jgi:hypothetical protein
MKCPAEVRRCLVQMIEENQESKRLYYEIVKQNQPFETWVNYIRRPGTWVGFDVTIFVGMMFDINICLVTNAKNGFYCFDLRRWLIREGENFLHDDAPTVFLYHHLYQRPFQKSDRCNHYGLLYPFEGTNCKSFQIYENEPEENPGTRTIIDVDQPTAVSPPATASSSMSTAPKNTAKKWKDIMSAPSMSTAILTVVRWDVAVLEFVSKGLQFMQSITPCRSL